MVKVTFAEAKAYQIHTKSETTFGFVLAYPGHALLFVEAPDVDLAIDAAASKILSICAHGNGPYLTRFVLVWGTGQYPPQ